MRSLPRVLVTSLVLAVTVLPTSAQSLPTPEVSEASVAEPKAETLPDGFSGSEVVSEPQQFDAETPARPTQPPQPLLGFKERIALALMRSFVPEDKQDEYGQVVQVADEVAAHVDRLRGVPQRGLQAIQPRRPESAPHKSRPFQQRPRVARPPANDAVSPHEAARRTNEDVVRRLQRLKQVEQQIREAQRRMEELRERHEAERREYERREQERQADERRHRERLEMERREADRERQKLGESNRSPSHLNPFRPLHARPDFPRPPHHRDHEGRGERVYPDPPGKQSHEARHHDEPSLNTPQFQMDALAREREGLRLEVDRIQAHLERARLRAATAQSAEAVAVWAVERVIELYDDDAPEILTDMRPQVRDELVKRYITMRLAELADRNRQRAIGPLRDLITDRLSDDDRRRDRD